MSVEAEILPIATRDGHGFDAQCFAAENRDAPVLLFMPAMGARAHFYKAFCAALAAADVSTVCFDWRGMESSSLRASRKINWGYREILEIDIPTAIEEIRARFPRCRLWIGGHSLGGQFGACYAAAHPEQIEGLVLIASGSVYYRGWPGTGSVGLLLFSQTTVAIAQVAGWYPGPRFGFGGHEARGIMRDWARVARTGLYQPSGVVVDYESEMLRLAKPLLAVSFPADRLAPMRATAYLLAKLPACTQTLWTWSAAKSGGRALNHFSWAREPDPLAAEVGAWVHLAPITAST